MADDEHDTQQATAPAPGLIARFLHLSAGIAPLARLSRRFHVVIFRLSRGRVMGRWFGAPVLVIEAAGRRTGRLRRTPVTFCPLGSAWVVVAINAGSPRTPAWWLNLKRTPEATVLLTGQRIPVRAREVVGAERERLWRRYAEQTPVLEQFCSFTDRPMPVIVLEPRGQAAAAR